MFMGVLADGKVGGPRGGEGREGARGQKEDDVEEGVAGDVGEEGGEGRGGEEQEGVLEALVAEVVSVGRGGVLWGAEYVEGKVWDAVARRWVAG